MREHPILFSTDMVRAILDGRKTQTRRVIKPQPVDRQTYYIWKPRENMNWLSDVYWLEHCPYGQVGDRLWVREYYRLLKLSNADGFTEIQFNDLNGTIKSIKLTAKEWWQARTAWEKHKDNWRPSIFMFKWASRITLEITEVRVERVQEIMGEDCVKEGITLPHRVFGDGDSEYYEAIGESYIQHFQALWNSLNAKRGYGWEVNPWVWKISFKKEEK